MLSVTSVYVSSVLQDISYYGNDNILELVG